MSTPRKFASQSTRRRRERDSTAFERAINAHVQGKLQEQQRLAFIDDPPQDRAQEDLKSHILTYALRCQIGSLAVLKSIVAECKERGIALGASASLRDYPPQNVIHMLACGLIPPHRQEEVAKLIPPEHVLEMAQTVSLTPTTAKILLQRARPCDLDWVLAALRDKLRLAERMEVLDGLGPVLMGRACSIWQDLTGSIALANYLSAMSKHDLEAFCAAAETKSIEALHESAKVILLDAEVSGLLKHTDMGASILKWAQPPWLSKLRWLLSQWDGLGDEARAWVKARPLDERLECLERLTGEALANALWVWNTLPHEVVVQHLPRASGPRVVDLLARWHTHLSLHAKRALIAKLDPHSLKRALALRFDLPADDLYELALNLPSEMLYEFFASHKGELPLWVKQRALQKLSGRYLVMCLILWDDLPEELVLSTAARLNDEQALLLLNNKRGERYGSVQDYVMRRVRGWSKVQALKRWMTLSDEQIIEALEATDFSAEDEGLTKLIHWLQSADLAVRLRLLDKMEGEALRRALVSWGDLPLSAKAHHLNRLRDRDFVEVVINALPYENGKNIRWERVSESTLLEYIEALRRAPYTRAHALIYKAAVARLRGNALSKALALIPPRDLGLDWFRAAESGQGDIEARLTESFAVLSFSDQEGVLAEIGAPMLVGLAPSLPPQAARQVVRRLGVADVAVAAKYILREALMSESPEGYFHRLRAITSDVPSIAAECLSEICQAAGEIVAKARAPQRIDVSATIHAALRTATVEVRGALHLGHR